MGKRSSLKVLSAEQIQSRILLIRGQKVMLDADLAELYGVSTKRLNEQVKRNGARFPADFMFRLTGKEKKQVVANCDHLQRLKFSPVLPYAFTEHGAVMRKIQGHDEQIQSIFGAIRQLMAPPESPWRRIGFHGS